MNFEKFSAPNSKTNVRNEGCDPFKDDPFKVNSYNFRYRTSRDPIANNVFPKSPNCDEECAVTYPIFDLGQYPCNTQKCSCNVPVQNLCGLRPMCCQVADDNPNPFCCESKASSHTYTCAEEKPKCCCHSPSNEKSSRCRKPPPPAPCCKEKQIVFAGRFCPNCPCSSCVSCKQQLEPKCSPPITISLKIQQGADLKIEKLSNKELLISRSGTQQCSNEVGRVKRKCGGHERRIEPETKAHRKHIARALKGSSSRVTVVSSDDSFDLNFLQKLRSSVSETTITYVPKAPSATKRKVFVYNGPKISLSNNHSQNSVLQSLGVSKLN